MVGQVSEGVLLLEAMADGSVEVRFDHFGSACLKASAVPSSMLSTRIMVSLFSAFTMVHKDVSFDAPHVSCSEDIVRFECNAQYSIQKMQIQKHS